jgi:hypothetical protein
VNVHGQVAGRTHTFTVTFTGSTCPCHLTVHVPLTVDRDPVVPPVGRVAGQPSSPVMASA